LLEVALFALVS